MTAARIIVVEDHPEFREFVRSLLADRFDLVAMLADASRVLPEIAAHNADVVVLNISLAGKSGLQTAREIAEFFPEVKVVFLSIVTARAYIEAAFQSGASAYVYKPLAPDDLASAIREALEGRRFESQMPGAATP